MTEEVQGKLDTTSDPPKDPSQIAYKLSFAQAQALVDYLSQRPYRESANFIQMLVSLEEV